ncbi:MAG: type II glyceraldehyde-3-phosphate dehydrogenase [Nanoarchaeota archaeon]|nr:type II glyceraldehyde-3-phosphate dehydrogenase [Nanoarchaeota archaeon]
MVRVVVNGVGAIGKRCAHAVKLQKDMSLVGVSDAFPSSILKTNLLEGALKDVPFFVSSKSFKNNFHKTGIEVNGDLPSLLKSGKVDVVIDATPKGVDVKYKRLYQVNKVKYLFQGGASDNITNLSFNSFVNYDSHFGQVGTRVVSCNTTSILRTVFPIYEKFGVRQVNISLVRRAVDPWNSKNGPVNSIVPVMRVPSHHGVDVRTVLPELNIVTQAVKVPTTLAHVHMVHLETNEATSTDEVKNIFEKLPRVKLLKASDGFLSTGEVMERARDLGRWRSDMPEVVVWDETVKVIGSNVYWIHAVHSESIVVPENVDAIRALTGLESDKWKSIKKTDKSLSI